MKRALLPCLLTLTLICCACGVRKIMSGPQGLYQIEGSWQLVITNDDDSALNGSVVSIDPVTADGIITQLRHNTYCVRPTDVLWKEIGPTAISNQFSVRNLVNSCVSGLEYKNATLILSGQELKLTGEAASGKPLLQTWKRIIK